MKSFFKAAAWFLAIFIIGIVIFYSCGLSPQTLEEYKQECIQSVNKELQNPKNAIKQRIESAHKTVVVTSAHVTYCEATTIDGSNNAGVNGSNISSLKLNIMTRWDGMIHKNGYTVFSIEYDLSGGKFEVKNAGIIETDALVNTEDPEFWYGVGYAVGYAVGYLLF